MTDTWIEGCPTTDGYYWVSYKDGKNTNNLIRVWNGDYCFHASDEPGDTQWAASNIIKYCEVPTIQIPN